MSVLNRRTARARLRGKLVFGNEAQIEAVYFLRDRGLATDALVRGLVTCDQEDTWNLDLAEFLFSRDADDDLHLIKDSIWRACWRSLNKGQREASRSAYFALDD